MSKKHIEPESISIDVKTLKEPEWRATHVLKPDLELLQKSFKLNQVQVQLMA
jgi:hypothetical protein